MRYLVFLFLAACGSENIISDTREPQPVVVTNTNTVIVTVNDTDQPTETDTVTEDTDTVPTETTGDTGLMPTDTGDTAEPDVDPCDVTERRLRDLDQDTYGDPANYETVGVCEPWLPGFVSWQIDLEDCDDNNAAVHPDADEVCNGTDDDCDGRIDSGDDDIVDARTFYQDVDGDGYGSSTATPQFGCEPMPGYSDVGDQTDCDDTDPDTYVGAARLDDPNACMNDNDGDGYGDDNHFGTVPPAVTLGTDCNDGWEWNHAQAAEHSCDDNSDNDCDGLVDENDPECQ